MVNENALKQQNPSYLYKNWNESQAACKADGGRLAVDSDNATHTYLYNILMANGLYPNYICFWIGAYSTIDPWHYEDLDGMYTFY